MEWGWEWKKEFELGARLIWTTNLYMSVGTFRKIGLSLGKLKF